MSYCNICFPNNPIFLFCRPNGPYWVKTPSGQVETFCDMKNGGWTLIGQTDGNHGSKYTTWLRRNQNTANLRTPAIEADTYSCIDAVNMAVDHATKVSQHVMLLGCNMLMHIQNCMYTFSQNNFKM